LNSSLHPNIKDEEARLITATAGPKQYIDFILDGLITISSITAEFDEIYQRGHSHSEEAQYLSRLQDMQGKGLALLQSLERILTSLQSHIGLFPPVNISHQSAPNSIRGPYYGKPMEYNILSLCRTAAMSLRLLMGDMDKFQGQVDASRLTEQRAALMIHAEAVFNTIPYSSQREIFGIAPFCFVPAFRMANAVLERESGRLTEEVGKEHELERCNAMKHMVQLHLDYVSSQKIPIKVDF
jgi:hypothetical protein